MIFSFNHASKVCRGKDQIPFRKVMNDFRNGLMITIATMGLSTDGANIGIGDRIEKYWMKARNSGGALFPRIKVVVRRRDEKYIIDGKIA